MSTPKKLLVASMGFALLVLAILPFVRPPRRGHGLSYALNRYIDALRSEEEEAAHYREATQERDRITRELEAASDPIRRSELIASWKRSTEEVENLIRRVEAASAYKRDCSENYRDYLNRR